MTSAAAGRIEFDETRSVHALTDGLRWYWDAFVAAHPDDEIYGFGFYDSLQHGHIDALVFTEAGLDRAVERYRYDRSQVRWSGGDSPHLLTAPDDSIVTPDRRPDQSDAEYWEAVGRSTGSFGFPAVLGYEQIDAAWDELVVDDDDSRWDAPWADYEGRARACCERALRELDVAGHFAGRRDGLTLLLTGEDESGVPASVARLNPPDVAARFAEQFARRGF
jgi:hypothetical protein